MHALIHSLLVSGIAFVHFDAEGAPVRISPDARLLLRPHVERGLVCLSREAHQFLTAGVELAAPREFDLHGCGVSLRVGAVAMMAAAGRLEVLMVISHADSGTASAASETDTATQANTAVTAASADSPLRCYFDSRQLTDRERQVAEHIATGLPSPAIATLLGISVHTVRRHTERVFTKTGARSRSGLTRILWDHNKAIIKSA